MGEWVRYKLDRRTDHILVDEAQDTNADQWDDRRGAGRGIFQRRRARPSGGMRTLFMVGDFKQAIFGFQGTDPSEFDDARRDWVRASSKRCARPRTSERRRAPGARVPRPVDRRQLPLGAGGARRGRRGDRRGRLSRRWALPEPPNRAPRALRPPARPGRAVEAVRGRDRAKRRTKARRAGSTSATGSMPTALADQVRRWLDEAPVLASTKRPLSPGDILILVRSRGELASLIVARLFAAGVPVAGIDRLHLSKPLAVQDLLAAVGVRGPAARRPQPRQSAGLAADRLEPGPAVRPRLRPRREPLWRVLRERAGEQPHLTAGARALGSTAARWPISPLRRASSRRSCPGRSTAAASSTAGSAWRRATRSTSCCRSALEFERDETPSLDRFLAWFGARRRRGQARPVGAGQGGAGDDRPRRQGAGGAGRDPRRCDRRPGQARRRRRSLRLPDAAASARSPLHPPAQGGARVAVRRADRRPRRRATSRSIGGCSTSA